MDEMDRLLSHLPFDPPPPDLSARICARIHARRQKRQRLRLGFSLLLAAGGVWLALPVLVVLPASLDLPPSGLPMLAEWLGLAFADLGQFLVVLLGVFASSGNLDGFNLNGLLGLAALGLSVWSFRKSAAALGKLSGGWEKILL